MRVSVRCTSCGSDHRSDLRELPDAKLVCPFCEHEADLPDDSELSRFEQAEARQRLFTVLGAAAFLLAVLLAVAYAGLSNAKPMGSGMGLGLLGGAVALGILGIVLAVIQESKASGNHF